MENTNTEFERLKNCNLSFINLSKEVILLIKDTLDKEQAGNLLFGLASYLYEGEEPIFNSKAEIGAWKNMMRLINRKADTLFKKAEIARENGKKGGRPKKEDNTSDLTNYSSTDDKSIAPIANNAIDSPEMLNNDNPIILTDEDKEKVEEIYNSGLFQIRVLDQIGIKDKEDIESDFINIMKHHNIYDYNSPIYRELERRFLNLINK